MFQVMPDNDSQTPRQQVDDWVKGAGAPWLLVGLAILAVGLAWAVVAGAF